jgi:hypothetical protein
LGLVTGLKTREFSRKAVVVLVLPLLGHVSGRLTEWMQTLLDKIERVGLGL